MLQQHLLEASHWDPKAPLPRGQEERGTGVGWGGVGGQFISAC